MTSLASAAYSALLLLLLSGCTRPGSAYYTVHVDTDAPLVRTDGALAPHAGLFDRLRIEVFDDQRDLVDVRDEAIHAEDFEQGPVSFGVEPHGGRRPYVHVVLYRAAQIAMTDAFPRTSIEVYARLPEAQEEDQPVVINLNVSTLGQATWLQPEEVARAPSPTSRAGSWPGAAPASCLGDARPDEVCVPGGAFWWGDPYLHGVAQLGDADEERLATMSAFFLDRTEVSTAAFRSAWPQLAGQGLPPPLLWSGGSSGDAPTDWATFTLEPTAQNTNDRRDDLPVNGVPWPTARAYCQSLGKDLPTEAMLEFAASGRGRENDYVWGERMPTCADVVVARASVGYYQAYPGDCRPVGQLGGALPSGQAKKDRISFDSDEEIVDLAGNLSEWALDGWIEQKDRTTEVRILKDPLEPAPAGAGGTVRRVVKGASWRGQLIEARAGARIGQSPELASPTIGFRCARSDD